MENEFLETKPIEKYEEVAMKDITHEYIGTMEKNLKCVFERGLGCFGSCKFA